MDRRHVSCADRLECRTPILSDDHRAAMGVVENIVTLCPNCHRELDEGKNHEMLMSVVVEYIKGFYPDWTPESVTYRKWR